LGRYHFGAAQAAYERFDLEQARSELDRCLRLWPRSYRAHLLAARTARRLHADDQAEQHLAACELLEGDTAAVGLESVLLQAQRGRLATSEEHLQQLIAADGPDCPLILEALAEGYFKLFQSPRALEALEQLLERQPANHLAYLLRGKVWEFLKQEEFALSDYERAVELMPKSDEARLRLAAMLTQVGKIREAAAHFDCLRKRQPDNLIVAVGLAHCLHDLADLDEAQQILDSVLAAHPDHVPALVERGRIAIRRAELDNAEAWLQKAVKLAPLDSEAHLVLYGCLQAERKREDADRVLAVLKKLNTNNSRLETLMSKVLETPRDLSLHGEIGSLLLQSGRVEEGVRWLERALRQDPGNARARAALLEHDRRKRTSNGTSSDER